MSEFQIKHRTETLHGIVRNEIYERDDMKYVEQFDDLTGKRLTGVISMYDGVTVCYVNEDNSISLCMTTNWVTSHKDMIGLISDLHRLDTFIAAVCEKYR